jgi:hypothetical protein
MPGKSRLLQDFSLTFSRILQLCEKVTRREPRKHSELAGAAGSVSEGA